MANTLYKLTNSEIILSQNQSKSESFKTFFSSTLRNQYRKLNLWFGIEERLSDRIIYYGTLFLMFLIPAATYFISELLY
ncbi:hypothetical protein CON18_14670 [Bacillus cereus]|uniref:hypothetical protein n=1 Tax=Bacillus cereus TaxID=1396 RepID=UPI000BED1EE4|nr:hypothetical protein [Bacillus cereus]PDZ39424.1 hypothetical protein CON18_14670 [Bacillus cereus]PGN74831.1 hypothetical protein CN963_28915 [Bacillus cereus]